MPSFADHLARVRAEVREISAAEAAAADGVTWLDVREPDETATGFVPAAHLIPRGFLEQRIGAAVPDPAAPIVVYCAGGTRSALAARTLAELGYTDVRSLAGGIAAWRAAGLAIAQPAGGLTPAQRARYARHLILPEVGEAGQAKLLAAKIALVGAGGLGSPAALYLAAAGVGALTIFDDDNVDVSNLQRQVIHTSERVGQPKVDSAARTIAALNPDVAVTAHKLRLTSERALALLAGHDVIVDGTDNFTTRYLVNDVALKLGVPVVHASVWRFEGQLSVFGAGGRPCYRCLYPEPPPPGASPSCAEAGVLGVLPGVMGILQATEAIKLVLGLPSVAGRLLVYDAVRTKLRDLALRADPACPTCGEGVDRAAIPLIDYAAFCSNT